MSQKDYSTQSKETLEQLLRETQDRSEAKKVTDELTKFYTKELLDIVKKGMPEKHVIQRYFKFIERFYNKLKAANIPEDTLGKLKKLQNKTFTGEKNCLDAIEKEIGVEQTVKYKWAILNSTLEDVSPKSRMTALLLCIFFGWTGIHYFYVERVSRGVLYLFTLGGFGVLWIGDIILISKGIFTDKNGLPVKN